MDLLSLLISFDESLFFAVNNLYHSEFLDWFFLFFSFYPLVIWMLIGGVITFIEERKDPTFIARLIIALVMSGFLASVYIKPIVGRPRPDISHGVKVTIVAEQPAAIPANNDFAFPSGHAAVAFAGAYILTREETRRRHAGHSSQYRRAASWIFYLLAGLTGISRIYLGKHYPLDVLGGAFLGIIVGWMTWVILDWIKEKILTKS